MPHGYCYLWNPGLVWLHVISDSLIASAYFTIPFTLLWLVRKRRDLPFNWMIVMFGVFIVACGATHIMEIWNLWHAEYWLAGVVKAITAASSVGTAILLIQLMPKAAELPNVNEWIRANAALESEIHERRELEIDLRISEARYRENAELLDLTHDAIFVRNLNSEILYWNRGAEILYGWQAEEAHRKISHDLLQTVFPKSARNLDAEILEQGYWEGELTHTRRDGSVVIVSSRQELRKDSSGNPLSILESNRDITHTKQEQLKFRALLEAAPDAMVIVDHEGKIHLINAQTEKMFGYSRDELIGKSVEILVPNRFQASHRDLRQGYERSPRHRSIEAGLELYGRRKDGSEFPAEISLSPLETPDGILISSAIRDVTQRKQISEKIRLQEIRFRLLIDAVKDYAIVSLDPSGLITTWNAGAQRLKGYAAEEIVGQHVSRLYPPDALAEGKLEEELRGAEASGHVDDQGWRVRKDGSRFWAEVVTTALRDPDGKLVGFVKIDKDITARREAEEQIQMLNKELNQRVFELGTANKELESFSYSVSHDLRAPLRHVDGFAHILKEEFSEGIPANGLKYLDRILDAATHMGHLVDDLLSLARIGRQEMKREKTDMGDLVKQAITGIPPEPGEREIEWRIEPLPELYCDPGLIRLALTNLLSNATKFTRKQPVAVIEVGSGYINNLPTIFVRDNGVGFDPRYADKLFGVFQRLHRQEDFGGTGVGLATVQRIVRRHGGEIWAQSKPGCGAEFSFTLGPQSRLPVESANLEVNHV